MILDTIQRSDLEVLRRMRNDESTRSNLSMPELINEVQQDQWFQKVSTSSNARYLAARLPNKPGLVGLVRITDIDLINRNACIGCDVIAGSRGRGYGQKIMSLAVDYCFKTLNLHMAWLLVADFNLAAKHVYAKVGFRETGRLENFLCRDGRYHDYVVMCKTRKEK